MATQQAVLAAERDLAQRRRSDRIWLYGIAAGVLALLTAVIGTALTWTTSRFIIGDVICGTIVILAIAAMASDYFIVRQYLNSRPALEAKLTEKQEELRVRKARNFPGLSERRMLYREEVTGVIGQYQADSRKYRGIHNGLQGLIMTGSAATTTIAALDTGKQLTWQSITLTGISLAITLAAMFTGYYKFRERSYFLQQTADSIEEETNAFRLGIGPYWELSDDDALAEFTTRVETLRNEQRRRQQQLDQPAEQSPPAAQPPT